MLKVSSALFFSDLHLGWWPCRQGHRRLMRHLYSAAGDAELIVLNGDIIDHTRRVVDSVSMAAILELQAIIARWRSEGRSVVYVEGNHDPLGEGWAGLEATRWKLDFEGYHGEHIRVLHGHRFFEQDKTIIKDSAMTWAQALENRVYASSSLVNYLYPSMLRPIIGLIGHVDTVLWHKGEAPRTINGLKGVDSLVCGHLHFGPGVEKLGRVLFARSGAWVGEGQRGSANRVLRYQNGEFQRLSLGTKGWRPCLKNQ